MITLLCRLVLPCVICFLFPVLLISAEIKPDVVVMIPMRDGVELPTNIYFPKNTKGKCPCVLVRHPLGRERLNPDWLQLLDNGYMLALQSTRSSCDQTGKSLPYITDGWGKLADGYDTVEWLGNCEWTNGKVATIGLSATGITQLLLAPTNPPHLVCQYIEVAAPSLYQYAVRPGGQFRKEQVEGWLKLQRRHSSVVEWLSKERYYNDFWKQFNALNNSDKVEVPQVYLGGWYDIFIQGTLDGFTSVQDHTNNKISQSHKLIVGPWTHNWNHSPKFGEFECLPNGKEPPCPITWMNWLDYYMKGIDKPFIKSAPIQYYVMGPFDGSPSSGNKWRSAHKWPPDMVTVQLYLHQDKTLSLEKAIAKEDNPVDVSFNPLNPVPTIGGHNLFLPAGPMNIQALDSRSDVVTFTTNVLQQDVEVTGRLLACLFTSNVFQERDVSVRLCDVYPDGKSILVAEGISHMSPDKSRAIEPTLVDLWSTSMVFAKGHRLRIYVAGSNFPAYEVSLAPNPQLLQDIPANLCFSLHSDNAHASYLALPIVSGDLAAALSSSKIAVN